MVLLDLIRKTIPIGIRQDLGLKTAKLAGASKLLAYPYFFLLCGKTPKNLKLLPDGKCSVLYNGNKVIAPRDGILAFIEVLQDEIYEKVGGPKEDDIVLDIGAYVGMFTLKVINKVGKSGIVVSVEPNPTNLKYLKENVNPHENIKVVEEAILDRIGEGKLYISSASPCHSLVYIHKDFLNVKINTIDNLVKQLGLPRVDFIKMDIEGVELQALEGAKEVLAKNNVRCAIASYHTLPNNQPEMPYIVNFFKLAGYQTKIIGEYVYAQRTS